MNNVRLIGDVHGKTDDYLAIAKEAECSIQLGDMGFDYEHMNQLDEAQHCFIGGNHENYDRLFDCHYNVGCYGSFVNPVKWFYVRGAISIDVLARVHEYMNGGPKTWWYEEELLEEELKDAVTLYTINKPRVMLTHDCPIIAKKWMRNKQRMLNLTRFGFKKRDIDCRTQVYLQKMFDAHEPELWVFGHYHRSVDFKIGNTRFICLNELEYIDVDTKTLEIK